MTTVDSSLTAALAAFRGRDMLMPERDLRAMVARIASRVAVGAGVVKAMDRRVDGGDGEEDPGMPAREQQWCMKNCGALVETVPTENGPVCRVRISGPMSAWAVDALWSGGVWMDALAAQFRKLAAEGRQCRQVGREACPVVLDWDCSGSTVAGIGDLTAAMASLAASRRCVSIVRDQMTSGAYWIGIGAEEVVTTATGDAGSVGVVSRLVSWSDALDEAGIVVETFVTGYKKDVGNPTRPIMDSDREEVRAGLEDTFGLFVARVAECRGIDPAVIRGWEAGVEMGQRAVAAGMVDRVIEDVEAYLGEVALTRNASTPAGGSGRPGEASSARRSANMATFKTAEELRQACPALVSEIERQAADTAATAARAAGKAEGIAEAAEKPASLEQLRSEFPGDQCAAFRERCLGEKMTVTGAVRAYNAQLRGEVAALSAKAKDAEERLAALSAGGARKEPIPGGSVDAGAGKDQAAQFGEAVAARIKAGASHTTAIAAVSREKGAEAHQAWVRAGCPGVARAG